MQSACLYVCDYLREPMILRISVTKQDDSLVLLREVEIEQSICSKVVENCCKRPDISTPTTNLLTSLTTCSR